MKYEQHLAEPELQELVVEGGELVFEGGRPAAVAKAAKVAATKIESLEKIILVGTELRVFSCGRLDWLTCCFFFKKNNLAFYMTIIEWCGFCGDTCRLKRCRSKPV